MTTPAPDITPDVQPVSRRWSVLRRNRMAMVSLVALGVIVVGCLVFGLGDSGMYARQNLNGAYDPPGPGGLFGADALGRSTFSRCAVGGLISLAVGLAAAVISVVVGTVWGATGAMLGGRVDAAMMRLVDILYGLPYILLVILITMALEGWLNRYFSTATANVVILFVAIGAVSWLTMARVIRGQVLSLKAQPFVEAARAAGVSGFGVFWRHLMPNLVGPILVYATLTVPQAILAESFLSFLGIGVAEPLPSWGNLAADGVAAINNVKSHWWLIVFPCSLLSVTLISLNFIGDGLRDAFDPKDAGG